VNPDALIEWVSQARSLELDEVMHEVLAPSHPEQKSWQGGYREQALGRRSISSSTARLYEYPAGR